MSMSMSMIGPEWLAAIFGVIMFATALGAAGRILVGRRTGRVTDYEVDGHHVLMGVSMAGMLLPESGIVASGPSTTIWIIVWVLVTIWFAISVARGAAQGGPGAWFAGHHLPHLVMSGAMLYMLAASVSPMSGEPAMTGMSGMGSVHGLIVWPTLDALFLVFMAGYAVLVIDRFPVLAVIERRHLGHAAAAGAAPRPLLAPGMAGAANIVMAVAMGYMLTMMFL